MLLGIMLALQCAKECKKKGKPFFNFKGYRFFEPGYDKVKFWGSVILFILYVISLPYIHFVPAGIIFGVLGYLMSKMGLPTAPFLIGFILGGDLETYFLKAVRGNNFSLAPFFTRPLALVIWVLILIFMGYSIWDNAKGRKLEKAGMKD